MEKWYSCQSGCSWIRRKRFNAPFSRPCEQLRLKKGPRSNNLWFKQQPRRSHKNTHSHHSPSEIPAMERWHAWTLNTFPNYHFLKRKFGTDKTCTWNKSEQIKEWRCSPVCLLLGAGVINNALVLYLCVCAVAWIFNSTFITVPIRPHICIFNISVKYEPLCKSSTRCVNLLADWTIDLECCTPQEVLHRAMDTSERMNIKRE